MGFIKSIFSEDKNRKLSKEVEAGKAECSQEIGKLVKHLGVDNVTTISRFEGDFNGRLVRIVTSAPDPEKNIRGRFHIGDQAVRFTFRFTEIDEFGNPIIENIEAWNKDTDGTMQALEKTSIINLATMNSILIATKTLLQNAFSLADKSELTKKDK